MIFKFTIMPCMFYYDNCRPLLPAWHGALFIGHDKLLGKIIDIVEILDGVVLRFAKDLDGYELVDDFPEVACLLDVPCVENINGAWSEARDEGVAEETAEGGPLMSGGSSSSKPSFLLPFTISSSALWTESRTKQ